MPTARLTTVALDPLRVMDAAHAFTSKLSTLFTGTRGPLGFDVLAVGVGDGAVVGRRECLLLAGQPSDRQIADRHPAARR